MALSRPLSRSLSRALGRGISGGIGLIKRLLDLYPGAAAAYSLQDIGGGGNVTRVRRSSDNAEQDFTAGQIGDPLRQFALNGDSDLWDFASGSSPRMYFDGINDNVTVAGMTAASNYFRACTIQATVFIPDASDSGSVFSLGIDCYRLRHFSGTWKINTTNTHVSVTEGIQTLAVDYNSSGKATALRINGATEWVGTASAGSSPSTLFNIGSAGSVHFTGLIYDFSLSGSSVKNFAFNGYGNQNSDWEDTVGSNDGTVNGSPALFTGQGFDAYVTTWYDQSGNGNDATQSTAASQPQIVDSGVIVTDDDGIPSMDFDGTDDGFFTSTGLGLVQPITAFCIGKSTLSSSFDPFMDGEFGGGRCQIGRSSSNFQFFAGTAQTPFTSDDNKHLLSCLYNGASSSARLDGTSSGTINTGTGGMGRISIGRDNPLGGTDLEGQVSELIVYDSDQSTNRDAIEQNIANRYGIALS